MFGAALQGTTFTECYTRCCESKQQEVNAGLKLIKTSCNFVHFNFITFIENITNIETTNKSKLISRGTGCSIIFHKIEKLKIYILNIIWSPIFTWMSFKNIHRFPVLKYLINNLDHVIHAMNQSLKTPVKLPVKIYFWCFLKNVFWCCISIVCFGILNLCWRDFHSKCLRCWIEIIFQKETGPFW